MLEFILRYAIICKEADTRLNVIVDVVDVRQEEYSSHSVRFGQLLRCSHNRIVNIMKVYIERNNIQVELIRFRKKRDFIDFGNFEVGIYFRDRRAHCYPLRVATVGSC